MTSATQAISSPLPAVTIADVATLCRQLAAASSNADGIYHLSFNQLFFFTLLWAVKEANRKRKEDHLAPMVVTQQQDRLDGLDNERLTQTATAIAEHLTNRWEETAPRPAGATVGGAQKVLVGDGATVGRLKAKDNQAWELLRIQMEKALRRYECPQATKDEAVANALVKVIKLLARLPDGQTLTQAPDIFAFFVEHQATLTSVYNFTSAFYTFAAQIARHTLFDELKEDQRFQGKADVDALVDWEALLSTGLGATTGAPVWNERTEQRLLQLRTDLINLLLCIDQHLPPRQRQVSLLTLAARSQFWLAVTMTDLPAPAGMQPQPGSPETEIAHILAQMTPLPDHEDKDIAEIIKITVNAVRVHRVHAKERICDDDPWLGERFALLIDPDLSNQINWWPEI